MISLKVAMMSALVLGIGTVAALALNPQPLPPKEASLLRLGPDRMLNPQPLPPRWKIKALLLKRFR
jgi:hypothetical protein